ncbi:MAG: hypothetical protein ABJB11_08495 [Ferruginibacter sp.]
MESSKEQMGINAKGVFSNGFCAASSFTRIDFGVLPVQKEIYSNYLRKK